MPRIEILTDIKDDGGYFKGEIRVVTPEKAGYLCGLGWARALDNSIPTSKPDTAPKKLDVRDGGHPVKSPSVKGALR